MNTNPLYKLGKLVLQQVNRKPNIGELGINDANLMFYNDGNTIRDRLPEYRHVATIAPYIIGEDPFVYSHQFSAKQLYAIMNQKIQDGDLVRVIVDERGQPRLDKYGKITLIPAQNKVYKEDYLLDTLEVFGKVCRQNPKEDIDVKVWFDEYKGYKQRCAEQGLHDTDEGTPDLIKHVV